MLCKSYTYQTQDIKNELKKCFSKNKQLISTYGGIR